MTMMIAVVKVL